MTAAAFRAWFERELIHLHKAAGEWIADGKAVPPTFVVFDGEGSEAVVVPLFETIGDKNKVAKAHRVVAMRGLPVVFVSECWSLKANLSDADVARLRASRDGIEHDPERTESVMWNARVGSLSLMAIAPIVRPQNTLGPWQIIDAHRAEGRFA